MHEHQPSNRHLRLTLVEDDSSQTGKTAVLWELMPDGNWVRVQNYRHIDSVGITSIGSVKTRIEVAHADEPTLEVFTENV